MHVRRGKLEQRYGESNCCEKIFERYSRLPRIQTSMEAVVGESLACERNPENVSDRYAVAVKKEGTIIGDLPRKVS